MGLGSMICDAFTSYANRNRATPAVAVCLQLLILVIVGAVIYPQTEPAAQPAQTTVPADVGPLPPEREGVLKPKDTFKECEKCPEMAVMPKGRFTMGSPATEQGRDVDESP